MKKLWLIIPGVVLFVIIVLLLLPTFFDKKVANLIVEKANQSLNAEITVGDVDLSLISKLPNLAIDVKNICIVNRPPFDGDTLASIKRFNLTVSLTALIFKREIKIQSLEIESPKLTLVMLEDGSANWDIMPRSSAPQTAAAREDKMLDLAIKKYRIVNGSVQYVDLKSNLIAQISRLNHTGSGDFSRKMFTLTTTTEADIVSLKKGGIAYLKNSSFSLKSDVGIDLEQSRYDIKQCWLKLNEMAISLSGWLEAKGQNLDMDLALNAPDIQFRDLLSMIPQIYATNFADLEANGAVGVTGKLSGTLDKETLPSIDLHVSVDDGSFRYRQRQVSVDDIALDMRITNPGAAYDATVIDLRRLHFSLLEKPVEMRLLVKTPISDPFIDGMISGGVNLTNLRQAIPFEESSQISGSIRSDLNFRGNLSAIEKRQFDRFFASGMVSFDSIRYSAGTLPEPVEIDHAMLTFRPQEAVLKQFEMRMGKSDIRATGALENIFGYVFAGRTLKGMLDIESNSLDLNPFLKQEGGAIAAIELPANIDFTMTGLFKRLYLTNHVIDNLQGRLVLRNAILYLENLSGDFLEGRIRCQGNYRYIRPDKPKIELDLSMTDISIPAMFKSVTTVKYLAPMAGYMVGTFGGELKLSSNLGDSLMPELNSLSGNGVLRIPKAAMEGFPPLTKLADALKMDKLRNPTLSNLAPDISIQNGRFHFKPITLEIGGYQIVASGSNGLDKSIDYAFRLHVPAEEISGNAGSPVAKMLKAGTELLPGQTVVIDAVLKGKFDNPEVSTSVADLIKGTAAQIKQEALRQAEQQKQQFEQQARQEIQEKRETVEDSLKKELEEKTKQEKEKIKDKIKGLFGK